MSIYSTAKPKVIYHKTFLSCIHFKKINSSVYFFHYTSTHCPDNSF